MMSPPFTIKVSTHHSHFKADLLFVLVSHRITPPAAAFEFSKDSRSSGSTFFNGLALLDYRDDVQPSGLAQYIHDFDAVEASVEKKPKSVDSQLSQPLEHTKKHLVHGFVLANSKHSEGVALAFANQICSGVGEEVGGSGLGFGAANLVLVLFVDSAMVRQLNKINGHSPWLLCVFGRDKQLQDLIELFFCQVDVLELVREVLANSGRMWSALHGITSLCDGSAPGSCKQKDIEKVSDSDLAAFGLERKKKEGLKSELMDICTCQGMMRGIKHADSPSFGLVSLSQS